MELFVTVAKPSISVVVGGRLHGIATCRGNSFDKHGKLRRVEDQFDCVLGVAIAAIKAKDIGCQVKPVYGEKVYQMPDKAVIALMQARESYARSNGRKHMAVEGIARWLLEEWRNA